MPDNDVLAILKIDLQINSTAADAYLGDLIKSAREAITIEGITLNNTNHADGMLIEMYAAYLYRARHGEDKGMPRMLRYQLNNRLFSEKANPDA